MYTPSHRSHASISNLSLPMDEPFTPPVHRMSVPPGAFVDSPTRGSRPRSKSPLRNSMTFDAQSTDGSPLPADDDPWGQRGGSGAMYSPSLTNSAPSVARFANNIAQRVNSLFSEPRSPSLLPTDAQLEAEAAAERDRSRREAERILNEERRKHDEHSSRHNSLPAPSSPSRGRSTSPAHKDKDGGWWNAAKQRLTPTKEHRELTPAQQIVQDTKAKEKQRGKSTDAPARERTLSTPSIPPAAVQTQTASPARDASPLYAQFRSDGALDVVSTLMTVARRFEKLERWTVGHVRALEERMNDVEKWLVDKEKEKEKEHESGSRHTTDPSTLFEQAAVAKDVEEMKDELVELKGRITEIGKEMVFLRRDASRPLPTPNVSSAPVQPPVAPAAVSSSVASLAQASTFSSGSITSNSSRTRGFPVGDYRSSDSFIQSPPTSPPSRSPVTLPSPTPPSLAHVLRTPSPLPHAERTTSPSVITPTTPQASSNLPAPPARRPPSISPPRKRYTVALGGGPISQQRDQMQTAFFSSATPSEEPAIMTNSASDNEKLGPTEDEDEDNRPGAELRRKETIGSTPVSISRLSLSPPTRARPDPVSTSPSPMARVRPRPQSAVFNTSPSPSNSRARTQSAYSGPGQTSIESRTRSRSIDRIGLGLDASVTSGGASKFVDPLVVRRKEAAVVSPKPVLAQGKGKIPIGQLVAFFDGDKGN